MTKGNFSNIFRCTVTVTLWVWANVLTGTDIHVWAHPGKWEAPVTLATQTYNADCKISLTKRSNKTVEMITAHELCVCVCAQCLHSRETEEERGGADEEERCCWHRNVAWGSQGSAGRDYSMREGGRGWTPPSALTTTAWHHFLLAVMCVSTNCYPKSFIISLKSSPRCTEWVWCAGTLILGTKVRKRRF